jgi:hypothetical protein
MGIVGWQVCSGMGTWAATPDARTPAGTRASPHGGVCDTPALMEALDEGADVAIALRTRKAEGNADAGKALAPGRTRPLA